MSEHGTDTRRPEQQTKVRPHKRHQTTARRIKFHSSLCAPDEQQFAKLDPSNQEQARRIQQRRKIVSYGKNTVGYDEYCKQVPKEKRRPRCMETPMTPDHTLDIPNKRWVGLVRAWRRALHTYDPSDLQKSFAAAAGDAQNLAESAEGTKILSVQERELAQAKSTGLLVEMGESVSPTSVIAQGHPSDMTELDMWDNNRGNTEFLCSDDEDSDDDLL